MKPGLYIATIGDGGAIVNATPFSGLSPLKAKALEQAVIWAGDQARTGARQTPEQTVAAAKAFEAFLTTPEPED